MSTHVLPPNPENFWPFKENQLKIICIRPDCSFRLNSIQGDGVDGIVTLQTLTVPCHFVLDAPVILIRDAETDEPLITMTLRKIETEVAFFQMSAHPRMSHVPRKGLN